MNAGVIFRAGLLLIAALAAGPVSAAGEKEDPFVIHRIAVDPADSRILYAITGNMGVLKSADGGASWSLSNAGLRSITHRALAADRRSPGVVYIGAWGGGVSRSDDRGGHWAERNDGLNNTAIESIALDPKDPGGVYVATPTGVYHSRDGGGSWSADSAGLPIAELGFLTVLGAPPRGPLHLLLGTGRGLYLRARGASVWERAEGMPADEVITALAPQSRTDDLYAGTVRSGLYHSPDGGRTWRRLSGPVRQAWVSEIALDPSDHRIVYVATRASGIWKTPDGGASWREAGRGLPTRDIRSLAIDPREPAVLYAGTTQNAMFKTNDGGETWKPLSGFPKLTLGEVLEMVSGQDSAPPGPGPAPPPEFSKCNACHGWTDSRINQKRTYWRVPPNRRDWAPTVLRMSARAKLKPDEIGRILSFLTEISRSGASPRTGTPTVARHCGRCHALEVMDRCLAGDCAGPRVARLAGPAPWGMVLDWMSALGATLDEADRSEARRELESAFPSPEYPLAWSRVPARFGEGGWNPVSLAAHEGHLYAGFEGNGRIFRTADGLEWREAADTKQYSVYGLTVFRGELYAGTHNPLPQIWRSRDGEHWTAVAELPAEDRGVISLAVFQNQLYAGTARGRIFRSEDGRRWGASGELIQASVPAFENWVRVLIVFGDYLYAGLEGGGLYRSRDGAKWESVGGTLSWHGVRGAAVYRGALYLGGTNGGEIRRSADGAEWQSVYQPPPSDRRGYVAAMAAAGSHLYAGVNGRVMRSADGLHWEEVGHLGPYTIESLAVFGGALYAGSVIPPSGFIYRAPLDQMD